MNPILRADRNAATLAGLVSGYAGLKGKDGRVLTADDFDIYNRRTDAAPEELTVQKIMSVLSRKK